jgi:hypothetical protein
MGGTIPLGYDVEDRKLVTNADEADRVRVIFAGPARSQSGRPAQGRGWRPGLFSPG